MHAGCKDPGDHSRISSERGAVCDSLAHHIGVRVMKARGREVHIYENGVKTVGGV